LARWLDSRDPELALGLQRLGHQSSQRSIEDAGLHLLGFEIVSGQATPRSLMSRIARARGPQLLVTGVSRNPVRLRELARLTALAALRTRACDVLLFSESGGLGALRNPPLAAASSART